MTMHAKFSPSAAHRWMRCPGSVALEMGKSDTGSEYAAEGTVAHEIAAKILNGSVVNDVDPDMLEHVNFYCETVRHLAGNNQILIEQRVDFSDVIGVSNSFGTSDCIILENETITLIDLKYGRGVRVDAEENEQLMLYALGALNEFGMIGTFLKARLIIIQPRLDHISEWVISIDHLMTFSKRVAEAAAIALTAIETFDDVKLLVPGEKQCRFCKAKAYCPALGKHVYEVITGDFENIDTKSIESARKNIKTISNSELGRHLGNVTQIEEWCKAVRSRVENELYSGNDVPGFKLVSGRRGARKWLSEEDVALFLRDTAQASEEVIFEKNLISPATAEKLLKAGKIGNEVWAHLQDFITQPDGKPSVAPADDKRPAIATAATADEFQYVA